MIKSYALASSKSKIVFEGKKHSHWVRITTPTKEIVGSVEYARRYYDLLLAWGFTSVKA